MFIYFGFVFSQYELNISCSWRIKKEFVLMGEHDMRASKITYKEIYDALRQRQVTDVFLSEGSSDLSIEFDNQIYLDLFIVSSLFEAWELRELKRGGRIIYTLPGGEIVEE